MDISKVDFGNYKRIVRAFWDPQPKNDDLASHSIWCLGREYVSKKLENGITDRASGTHPVKGASEAENPTPTVQGTTHVILKEFDGDNSQQHQDADMGWPSDFLDDCEARFWFTYRSSFPRIEKSSEASMTFSVRLRNLGDPGGFTSDTGWGCMIRSGQSLLANTLTTLRLGRDWRPGLKQDEERKILSLFADDPIAPFSIHRFVEHGASACGKHPGEWFGPSATARCIQALSDDYHESGLRVYVNGDGADVYEDRFLNLAKSGTQFIPTLILMGVRLGIDRITTVYWDALKDLLRLPQSVGIAGGRPSSSHYFFAIQGDQFFYLDPHFTRPALRFHSQPKDYTTEEIESCHTRRLRRLSLKDMDPSMLIGFLIKDENEWWDWKQRIRKTSENSIIHVTDTEPSLRGYGTERPSAVDDVEILDDDEPDEAVDEDEGDGTAERSQTSKSEDFLVL